MRVLILTISYHPNVGGVETHLHDWTRWLAAKEDLEIDVLTYQPITTKARGLPREMEGRVRIFRIPWIGRNLFHKFESKPIVQFLYLAPRLLLGTVFHLMREGRYDVIHAQGLISIWVAGKIRSMWKIPVLGSLHTVYLFQKGTPTGERIARVLMKADKVLSCAEAGYRQMIDYGLPESKVGQFTYWVNQTTFSPQDRNEGRRKFHLPMDKKICLFVGRLLQVKGLEIFFELAKRFPDLHFVSSGDGPLDAECQRMQKELPNFQHLSFQKNETLAALYSACDVLLVPSLFTEGIPRVSCEAFSCGLPVIGSNRGGMREAIKDGVGLLVEPTADSFSKALEEWFKTGTTEQVRRNCRIHAEERFSVKNAEKMEQTLRTVAKVRTA